MPLEKVLAAFKKPPRRSGKGYLARCPAHGDRRPSLTIGEGADGRVLLNCFAGCRPENVVAALGLSMKDLFPERPASERPRRQVPVPFPSWIEADSAWAGITHAGRWLLVVLARHCWHVLDAAGSLGHAGASKEVLSEASMSRSTFYAAARALTEAGFIVKISQGGGSREGPCLTMIAIPGRRGALGAGMAFDGRRKITPRRIGGALSEKRTVGGTVRKMDTTVT